MYELIKATDRTYYIESPAKIGLFKINDSEVCLIDSGSDKDAARKVRQILDANGWTLTTIYNTHSNADHIGGNKYLQLQTGCKIYAPDIERDFTRHPILEPAFLYGGYPHKDLRHKFLLASDSVAEPLTDAVLPDGFQTISLPGHFFSMVGFRTPDDVVFLADCLSSAETLSKYQIGFIYDVAAYLETLEMVKTLKAKLFVPSHADATESISELCDFNIKKVLEIKNKILSLCEEPISFETLLQRLFSDYSLNMNFQQHALVGSTVRSYLSYLKDTGAIEAFFNDNILFWKKV